MSLLLLGIIGFLAIFIVTNFETFIFKYVSGQPIVNFFATEYENEMYANFAEILKENRFETINFISNKSNHNNWKDHVMKLRRKKWCLLVMENKLNEIKEIEKKINTTEIELSKWSEIEVNDLKNKLSMLKNKKTMLENDINEYNRLKKLDETRRKITKDLENLKYDNRTNFNRYEKEKYDLIYFESLFSERKENKTRLERLKKLDREYLEEIYLLNNSIINSEKKIIELEVKLNNTREIENSLMKKFNNLTSFEMEKKRKILKQEIEFLEKHDENLKFKINSLKKSSSVDSIELDKIVADVYTDIYLQISTNVSVQNCLSDSMKTKQNTGLKIIEEIDSVSEKSYKILCIDESIFKFEELLKNKFTIGDFMRKLRKYDDVTNIYGGLFADYKLLTIKDTSSKYILVLKK